MQSDKDTEYEQDKAAEPYSLAGGAYSCGEILGAAQEAEKMGSVAGAERGRQELDR